MTAQQCAIIHEVETTFEAAQGFKPRDLTINAGDCVRWTNKTTIKHSAVAVGRSFHTVQLMPWSANVLKFAKPARSPAPAAHIRRWRGSASNSKT